MFVEFVRLMAAALPVMSDSATDDSPGVVMIVALVGVIVFFVVMIVLWNRLNSESPEEKRRHLAEGEREALKRWDQVQRDRMAGRFWNRYQ